MAHHSLRLAAARYALGLAHTEEVVQAAHDALDEGVYSYSLGELATFPRPAWSDVAPLLEAALNELGIPRPSKTDAVGTVLACYIRPLAEGTVRPADGLARLYSEVYLPLIDSFRLNVGGEVGHLSEELVYHLHAYEEIEFRSDLADADSVQVWVRELDAETVSLARRWSREHTKGSLNPGWLTSSVLGLAKAISAGAFDRLPILADALEEAGCNDADILTHCRGSGSHTEWCWVVDLLLSRGQ